MKQKKLNFWDSIAINVGVIIGVGIFRTPGAIAKYVDSAPLILLTWALGGLIALVGVFCYAELAFAYPKTGGTYVYLRESFGKPVGFLFGWAEFSVLRAGSIAGVAYILVDYLGKFLPFAAQHEKISAIAAIWIFTFINIRGLHLGAAVQNILTLLKIAAIALIGGTIFSKLGFIHFDSVFFHSVNSHNFSGMAPALIPVLWTYGGWHQSTFISGEFHDAKKDLPKSLILGILIVGGIYLFLNAAYLTALTPAQTAGTRTIASDILGTLFGTAGKTAITIAVLISASGALNSTILTGGCIPFAVAGDYPRLSWVAHLDERFQTPLRSFMINGVWASVLVLWGNFDQLLFFFAFTNWLFFSLTGLSVFKIVSARPSRRPALNLGYPWIPVIFIFSCAVLCVITIFTAPWESLFGALLLLTGLPVYYFCSKK